MAGHRNELSNEGALRSSGYSQKIVKKGVSPYLGESVTSADESGPSTAVSEPAPGRRAPKLLEAKWKISALRSPLCEGCGQGSASSPLGAGSKFWKCGPCVRALEESYLRALDNLEQEHEMRQEQTLATGVRSKQLREELQKRGYEVEKLSLLLHEAESKISASNSFIQQLMAQLSENKTQHQRLVDLQNQVMTDNARLHGSAQTAGSELERSAHIVRDLEYANQVMRDENQKLSQRVQGLLDTVASLRDELRGSFKAQEASSKGTSAERREWQEALRTLEVENEDMRRRLRWLEDEHRRGRDKASFVAARR